MKTQKFKFRNDYGSLAALGVALVLTVTEVLNFHKTQDAETSSRWMGLV